MRQSFKPGEIDPETANKIGYELALEFTGGNHAFVVATHTDKAHIHNHVMVNAFNLESDGKFKDPWRSGKRVIAKISDRICNEYELSVIEVKQGWADPYNVWEEKQGITKAGKEPNKRKQLEDVIALCLEKKPKNLKQLLRYLEDYSCYAKKRGKEISITTPFSKNPFRLSSLSDDFTEDGIKRQIAKLHTITNEPKELRLIIDIRNSLKATENTGYKKWAEKFNLEQMSQTLLFIDKHQLSLAELENMATQKPKVLQGIKADIEIADEKLQQISLLQRHIGNYGKTKVAYKQLKQSKTPEQFREDNNKAIADHEAARAYFDEQGYGFGSDNKLPTIKELREQYANILSDKKSLWAKYHEVRNSDKEVDNAWLNVKTLLNLKDDEAINITKDKKERSNAPNL